MNRPRALRSLTLVPDGRAGGWRVAREEGPDPAAALVGRTPEEAARLAPLVFNLCGAAHAFAARSALGLPAAADAETMARETVRDHALALLHTVPVALGMAPDRAALARLARPDGAAFHAALVGDGSDLSAFSPAALEAWLAEAPTPTARAFARIRTADPAEGRVHLPELSADVLAATLARPPAAIGSHRETSALGRVAATPLVSAMLASEGPSLFVRLLARLVDGLAHLSPGSLAHLPGTALPAGIAPAARGLLGHRADVQDGRVAAYRILSPSAWNLAPGGLLERAFAALSPGWRTRWLAPLLVCAINPCVPVTLSFAAEPAYA